MPRTHLLDTRTSNFSDLIGNGKIYRVPLFQRDYSWKEENWEDLWQDIQTLYENPDSSHYMGAIVLQGSQRSDTDFTIIDGQQRLVTISILAIAIIEKIQMWLFGLCYAMDGSYKGWTPYIERHLAIFVNCFFLERTNQLSLLPDKDLVDLCPPIEPYQVTKNLQNLLFVLHFINAPYRINFENFAKLEIGRKQGNIKL